MYIIVRINGEIRALVTFRDISDLESILDLLNDLGDGSSIEVLISSGLSNKLGSS